MNTTNIATQAASCLPNYGPVTDWTFCQTKESYLAFVKEWKATYKLLSAHVRYGRLEYKLSCAKNPEKIERLKKQLASMPQPGALPPWLSQSIASAGWRAPWKTPSGRLTYYDSAVASWMLHLRAQAKVHAAAAYQAAKAT